jgi:DNA-binding response OmpR family regulator
MKVPKGRILCVDDDKDTLEMMTSLLGYEDYEVVQAQTVAEGLALAIADNFDLILLDFVFADGTGIELCRMIRETGVPAPILFYSGMALKEDIDQALSAGAQGFLIKPADLDELLLHVSRFVGNDGSTPLIN